MVKDSFIAKGLRSRMSRKKVRNVDKVKVIDSIPSRSLYDFIVRSRVVKAPVVEKHEPNSFERMVLGLGTKK